MVKKIVAAALVAVSMLTTVSAARLTDISGHWAESEVLYAIENKMVSGYLDNTFKPDNTVTRAEFVKMLVASFCANLDIDTEDYKDSRHWVFEYYNLATATGMLSVDGESSHDGVSPALLEEGNCDYPIKRWEMAYILCSMYNNIFSSVSGNELSPSDYTDSKGTIEKYGEDIDRAIGVCITAGFLNGDPSGNFNAHKNGTRAEAITIVNRMDRFTKEVLATVSDVVAEEEFAEENLKTYTEIPSGHPRVKFEMAQGGSFTVELYPEYAPQTVANFVSLVQSGFYNGLKFHRVIADFMAQGGCPIGNGTGSADGFIKGEFTGNGFEQNTIRHERGTISMARAAHPNSASCQFFICYSDAGYLDGQYAAFGKVIEGMETVDSFLSVGLGVSSSGELSVPNEDIIIKSAVVIN